MSATSRATLKTVAFWAMVDTGATGARGQGRRGSRIARRGRGDLSSRARGHRTMIVPLTLADFLGRAELVYGPREAGVGEPTPPGGGPRRVTYAPVPPVAASPAAPPAAP